jgi:transposase-like protein
MNIKIKRQWKYLYRAIDKKGDTLDFRLFHKRGVKLAKLFIKKALKYGHKIPVKFNKDKKHAYS